VGERAQFDLGTATNTSFLSLSYCLRGKLFLSLSFKVSIFFFFFLSFILNLRILIDPLRNFEVSAEFEVFRG
jgi:hypothetical protein